MRNTRLPIGVTIEKDKPMPKQKDPVEGHHITIGGITLESDSGKLAYIEPIARYEGLDDKQLQEVWHHLQTCKELREIQLKMSEVVLAHMTEFGDARVKDKKR